MTNCKFDVYDLIVVKDKYTTSLDFDTIHTITQEFAVPINDYNYLCKGNKYTIRQIGSFICVIENNKVPFLLSDFEVFEVWRRIDESTMKRVYDQTFFVVRGD